MAWRRRRSRTARLRRVLPRAAPQAADLSAKRGMLIRRVGGHFHRPTSGNSYFASTLPWGILTIAGVGVASTPSMYACRQPFSLLNILNMPHSVNAGVLQKNEQEAGGVITCALLPACRHCCLRIGDHRGRKIFSRATVCIISAKRHSGCGVLKSKSHRCFLMLQPAT